MNKEFSSAVNNCYHYCLYRFYPTHYYKWYTICCTNFPTVLIVPSATAVEVVNLRDRNFESVFLYRECKNIEKVLLRYVQSAVDGTYQENLVDKDTGLGDNALPTILEYPFTNYGTLQSEEVNEKEQEVFNLTFQPLDPMVILYRPINQLMKLAKSVGSPHSKV